VLPANLMGIEEGFASSVPSMVSGQQPMTLRMPTRSRLSMPASMPSTPSISSCPSMNSMSSLLGNQQSLPISVERGDYSQPAQPQIPTMSTSFGSQPSMDAWELSLRFIPPTCPVDAILIGVLDRQRNLARSGTDGQRLIGPL
jgi:hypothetical protein